MNNVFNILGILCFIGLFIAIWAIAVHTVISIIQSVKEGKKLKEELKVLNKEKDFYNLQVVDFDFSDNKDYYGHFIKDAWILYCLNETYDIKQCRAHLNKFFSHIDGIRIQNSGRLNALDREERNEFGNFLNQFHIDQFDETDGGIPTFIRATVDLDSESIFKQFIRGVVKEYENYKYNKRKQEGYYDRR